VPVYQAAKVEDYDKYVGDFDKVAFVTCEAVVQVPLTSHPRPRGSTRSGYICTSPNVTKATASAKHNSTAVDFTFTTPLHRLANFHLLTAPVGSR